MKYYQIRLSCTPYPKTVSKRAKMRSFEQVVNAAEHVRIEVLRKINGKFCRYLVRFAHQSRMQQRHDDMISAYLNILLYVEGEKKINYALAKFERLDEVIKQEILKLSRDGRYIGISRVGGNLPRDERFRRRLLNLIEDFNSNKTYEQLMDRLDTFAIKTKSCARASITGILSALREEEFMVYNTRSTCPLFGTECEDLADGCMVK